MNTTHSHSLKQTFVCMITHVLMNCFAMNASIHLLLASVCSHFVPCTWMNVFMRGSDSVSTARKRGDKNKSLSHLASDGKVKTGQVNVCA